MVCVVEMEPTATLGDSWQGCWNPSDCVILSKVRIGTSNVGSRWLVTNIRVGVSQIFQNSFSAIFKPFPHPLNYLYSKLLNCRTSPHPNQKTIIIWPIPIPRDGFEIFESLESIVRLQIHQGTTKAWAGFYQISFVTVKDFWNFAPFHQTLSRPSTYHSYSIWHNILISNI